MTRKKIFKFGGSSVKDALSIERCLRILEKEKNEVGVVVSATYNTTNQLELLARALTNSETKQARAIFQNIMKRHFDILEELAPSKSIEEFKTFCSPLRGYFEELINGQRIIDSETQDSLYSFGELLSSWIFSRAWSERNGIQAVWVDAREIIKTNSAFNNALPQLSLIREKCGEYFHSKNQAKSWVTQGFIGSDEQGRTTTLGREGSDFTATLLAESLGAENVTIWTDVDGVWSADPRIVANAKKIDQLSYEQADFLASHGAKVLFSQTLAPAKRGQVKVRVASSFEEFSQGTLICESSNNEVNAITKKEYDDLQDELAILFSEKKKKIILSLIKDFTKTDEQDKSLKVLVPRSIALETLLNIHAALVKS